MYNVHSLNLIQHALSRSTDSILGNWGADNMSSVYVDEYKCNC